MKLACIQCIWWGLDVCISQDCSHYNRLYIFCFVFCLGNPFQSFWYWKLPDSFAASFCCPKAWCDSMATGPGMVRWDALQQRETSIFVCIKTLGFGDWRVFTPKMSHFGSQWQFEWIAWCFSCFFWFPDDLRTLLVLMKPWHLPADRSAGSVWYPLLVALFVNFGGFVICHLSNLCGCSLDSRCLWCSISY